MHCPWSLQAECIGLSGLAETRDTSHTTNNMLAIKTLRGNAQQIYDKSLNIQKLKHFDHLWAILDNLRLYLPNMHVFLKKKYGWGGFSKFVIWF